MHVLALALINATLSWALPFFTSFLFFNAEGDLQTSEEFFGAMMGVIFSFYGAMLLQPVLRRTLLPMPAKQRARGGIAVGVGFLLVNYLLDLNVFIPVVNSLNAGKAGYRPWTPERYFIEIGPTVTIIIAMVRYALPGRPRAAKRPTDALVRLRRVRPGWGAASWQASLRRRPRRRRSGADCEVPRRGASQGQYYTLVTGQHGGGYAPAHGVMPCFVPVPSTSRARRDAPLVPRPATGPPAPSSLAP